MDNKVFGSVFNNIYINNVIENHNKLFNIFKHQRIFNKYENFEKHSYKDYLLDIAIYFEFDNFNIFPENIQSISFKGNEIKSAIPQHIKSFTILGLKEYDWSIFSNANNLESLSISSSFGRNKISEFSADMLPSSITDMYIDSYEYPIKRNTLPKNLKKLHLVLACDTPIEVGSMPDSLTSLSIGIGYSKPGIPFESNYLPKGLKELDLLLNSLKELPNDFKLPDSLTVLKILCNNLPPTFTFPPNLKTLELYTDELKEDLKLPQSLEHLELCLSQQQSFSIDMIPRKLKSLTFNSKQLIDLNGNSILPNTLESLVLTSELYNNRETPVCGYNQQLLPNMLPSSLTSLTFSFSSNFDNGGTPLTENIFPSSLTHLDLGDSFNQPIGANTISGLCLKTLVLGSSFNQEIIEGSLPPNLQELEIRNFRYDKFPINVSKYTTVVCKNYYTQFEKSPQSLYNLKFKILNEPLKALSLQNKSNLESLDLGFNFSFNILKEDLPTPNNIKKLVVGKIFDKEINLDEEFFPSLEQLYVGISKPILKSNITINKNFKKITVIGSNVIFLDNLDPIFFKYLDIIDNK
ncbi:hypothetical protein DICPUDRAFT_76758 [Dictyostelium purpureum]|uniref:FNIP repeat-containing protein n=1 Tax=Dictyostelium purpureum TaxID=5786 RepID=F0ZEJ2_DICPU|nr:uncharacterized protein DICPUDRAFT_76758 [Dictyostelium purpureum]EGC37657.1 hypothetical protein DICPUDRAFT_76758 [Dictyostelium purpureum]|eukprot:XP_003285845.1 hypothetical protein DICPUDRAFT_76758 [Dictyostelium purpureum]